MKPWLVSCLSLLALGSTAGSTSGCTSVARQESLDAKEAKWHSIEVKSPSDRVLWQLTLLSLQNQGFPLAAGTDPGAGEVATGWKNDMQPFRGKGERRRAIVRMKPLEPGRWKLEARVQVEHNQNLVTPLDASRADWKPIADDEALTMVVLQHIRARLGPEFELSPAPKSGAGGGLSF
jgi:hypothetical protein